MLNNQPPAVTFIELVLVIALLSIIAVVSFVAIGSFKYQQVRTAAEKVAADIRYAQNLALTSNIWHGLDFDAAAHTYTVYQTDGVTDAVIKKADNPTADFVIVLGNEFSGITISSVDIGGGSKVEFNYLGEPYLDKAGSALGATATITLAGGLYSAAIKIEPGSGRVYIQ